MAPDQSRLFVEQQDPTRNECPFLFVYDLVLLTVPLLWSWREARITSFLPWEKAVLMLAFFTPLIAVEVAYWLHLPIAQLTIVAVFLSVARRGKRRTISIPTESH